MYRLHLEKLARTRLDDVLVDERILDRARLEEAQAEQDQTGKLLSDVLIDSGAIDDWDLAKLVASAYQLPFIDVASYSIPAQAADLLPLDWCRARGVLPLDQFGKSIALACVEVPTPEVVHEIIEKTGCTPFLYAAARRPLRNFIDESVKRRAGRAQVGGGRPTFSAKPAAAAAPAAAPAAGPAPAAVPAPAPAPAPAAAPEIPALAGGNGAAPRVPPRPATVNTAGLPRVSFQLNASAAGLSASASPFVPAAHAATPSPAPVAPAPAVAVPPVRRPAMERSGRPAIPSVVPSGPATGPVVPSVPGLPPATRLSPMQQLLSRPAPAPAAPGVPSVPAMPAPGPAPGMPQAPKLGSRAAPVLPQAEPAAAGAPKGGWESIFDIGDSAVKRQSVDSSRNGDRLR